MSDEKTSLYQQPITLYTRRWITTIIQLSFASIQNITLAYFGLGSATWKVNLMTMIYMACNIPGSLIAGLVLKRFGLAFTLNFAAIIHLIGCWVRVAGSFFRTEWGFWIVFVGQCMGALVSTWISCSTTQVSFVWFSKGERTIATTISAFSNMFGAAVVFALSILVSTSPNASYMPWYFLIQAIFATILGIGSILVIRSNPPTPSSFSHAKTLNSATLREDIWALLGDSNFVIVAFVFGFTVGSINCFISLVNQVVTPKGYSAIEAALIGIFIILFGMAGSTFFGIIAAKTKKILGVIWVCAVCATITFIVLVLVLRYDRTTTYAVLVLICAACIGIFGPICVPLFLELGAETSFPIESSSSNILMVTVLNCTSICFIIIQDLLQTRDRRGNIISMQNSMYFAVITLVFGFAMLIFYSGSYKRMEHDHAVAEPINE